MPSNARGPCLRYNCSLVRTSLVILSESFVLSEVEWVEGSLILICYSYSRSLHGIALLWWTDSGKKRGMTPSYMGGSLKSKRIRWKNS